MRTLTKTGIRILSAKYRSILIKCAIINASVFIGAFGATSAMAAHVATWSDYKNGVNNESDATIKVNADITYDGSAGATNEINRSLSIIKNTEGNDTNLILDGKYSDVSQTEGLTVGTGGALTITNITMQNFTKATSDMMGQANGGAINNEGTITDIIGDFNSNAITASGQMSYANGGAIYNNGIIGNTTAHTGGIKGNFISNSANSNFPMAFARGGAIYNDNNGIIENIEGDFTSNHSNRGGGGAIYNNGTISNIKSDLTSNYSEQGGAIYNSGTIENIEGDFISNYATETHGGGIYNTGSIKSITSNFIGNYVTNNYGGAIYNDGSYSYATLNIVANNGELKFDGNYLKSSFNNGGAIYNTGTVGLYAINDTDKITFTGSDEHIPDADKASAKAIDDIYNTGTLNINGDGTITPYTGTVNLYNVTDAATARGTTNIYGGTVNVVKELTQNNINVKSGATLSSTTNGASIVANDTFTNAGTVNMSGDGSLFGAVNLNNNGTIDAINVLTDDSLTNNNTINATGIEVGEKLTNNGAIEAVNLLANDIANNGNITATNIMLGSATNNSGASLTVNGKINTASLINEGKVIFNNNEFLIVNLINSGTVNFNGYLNYPDSNVSITQNAGTINFSDMADTEGNPIKVFTMNGGSVNIADGRVNTLHVDQLKLTRDTNFAMDADLAAESMDKIQIHDFTTSTFEEGKVININKINLLSDANDDYVELSLFADDNTKTLLANNISGNLTGLKYSTIYKYDALYNPETGMIGFTRYESGTSDDFNPYLYTPSVAAQATANITGQIATLVMDKMDDVVHTQGRSGGDTPSSANAWVKVMGLDDNVEFNNFENIDSKAMTVTAGYNTNKITCGDCGAVFGVYAGYIGGKQQYTDNDTDQDGGYVGLSSALTLGNAFLTATVNGGLLKNKSTNMYGTDEFKTLWLGTGLKTGYNYAINDSVVLQPNVYGGYTLVNTKDYTSVSGVKIATNNLNFFEIDPGLKLSAIIADGWTTSVQGKYAIVMDNGGDITANDIILQNISTKNYFEYGIGIDKSLTDAFYLGVKINRRDGGRTGWNGSIEFRYKF